MAVDLCDMSYEEAQVAVHWDEQSKLMVEAGCNGIADQEESEHHSWRHCELMKVPCRPYWLEIVVEPDSVDFAGKILPAEIPNQRPGDALSVEVSQEN